MSVVTFEEFRNFMGGRAFSAVQKVDAEAALDSAQSELERYINRPLQIRRVLEEVTTGYQGIAWLKVTPVIAVHGLKRINPDTGAFVPLEGFSFQHNRGANYIVMGHRTAYVDYTGGINADVDPGVKAAIKRVAARGFSVQHEEFVSISPTGDAEVPAKREIPEAGWTVAELERFTRLRRRTIV